VTVSNSAYTGNLENDCAAFRYQLKARDAELAQLEADCDRLQALLDEVNSDRLRMVESRLLAENELSRCQAFLRDVSEALSGGECLAEALAEQVAKMADSRSRLTDVLAAETGKRGDKFEDITLGEIIDNGIRLAPLTGEPIGGACAVCGATFDKGATSCVECKRPFIGKPFSRGMTIEEASEKTDKSDVLTVVLFVGNEVLIRAFRFAADSNPKGE